MNMVNMNNNGTMVGPPCKEVYGGKIRPILQYGGRRWVLKIAIHTEVYFPGGTQIEETLKKGQKISR